MPPQTRAPKHGNISGSKINSSQSDRSSDLRSPELGTRKETTTTQNLTDCDDADEQGGNFTFISDSESPSPPISDNPRSSKPVASPPTTTGNSSINTHRYLLTHPSRWCGTCHRPFRSPMQLMRHMRKHDAQQEYSQSNADNVSQPTNSSTTSLALYDPFTHRLKQPKRKITTSSADAEASPIPSVLGEIPPRSSSVIHFS